VCVTLSSRNTFDVSTKHCVPGFAPHLGQVRVLTMGFLVRLSTPIRHAFSAPTCSVSASSAA
jgi:hypothetical protein